MSFSIREWRDCKRTVVVSGLGSLAQAWKMREKLMKENPNKVYSIYYKKKERKEKL